MRITINDFIDCVYNSNKEICTIYIYDQQTIPPNRRTFAEWRFKKQEMEDAIQLGWLLFEEHDEVWIPVYNENGQRGEALIISAEYADNKQLTHANFNQQGSNFTLCADLITIQAIHKFWENIVAP